MQATKSEIIERFRGLFLLPEADATEILGAVGYAYYNEYFSGRVPADVYVEKVRLMAKLLDLPGRDALDLGCGNGFVACLLEAFGAKSVMGVDIAESKIPFCYKLADYLGCEVTAFSLTDGQDLPFDDGSFDAVSTTAALSHVRNINTTLRQMHRVLRPGGLLYVFEDNNAMHFRYQRIMYPVWRYAESGVSVWGHRGRDGHVPFIERRREKIKSWFPDLSDERIQESAERTRGLVQDEIREAVRQSLDSNKQIPEPHGFTCYNPDTGEALEYPFTPPLLREFVSRYFDNAQVHCALTPPYRGLKGIAKRVLKVLGTVIEPVLCKTHQIYVVTGERRH